MITNNLPAALQTLDKIQRDIGIYTFRKIEEDEISRMESDPSYQSFWSFLRDPFYRELSKRIPPLQSMVQFKILEDKNKYFEEIIKTSFSNQEKYCTSENIYFGTVIKSQLNAHVKQIENQDEYLIILNEILWEAMRYISDVFAAPISFKENEHGFDIDYVIAQEHAHRFGEIMHRLVNSEHIWGVDLKFNSEKNETWQFLWNIFHDAMESFSFGHEYGHFVRRHQFKNKNSTAEKWASEYDADMVAIDLIAISILSKNRNNAQELLLNLCGCSLFYMLLLGIEEFQFSIFSELDNHPPTIFRFAIFKRKCFEQMGSRGLTELDKYISSIQELENFYINKSDQIILENSFNYSNTSRRIEFAFQKSIFWNIFRNTHDEIIIYLDKLYCKFDCMNVTDEICSKSFFDLSHDDRKILIVYISNSVLSLTGTEDILKFSLQKNILNKIEIMVMIRKCCDVIKMNKEALAIHI